MVTNAAIGNLQFAMPCVINATPRGTLKYAAMLLLITGLAWVSVSSQDFGRGLSSPTAGAAVLRESHDSSVLANERRRDVQTYPDPYFAGGHEQEDTHSDWGYFYYEIY